jgi:hypothetical protein
MGTGAREHMYSRGRTLRPRDATLALNPELLFGGSASGLREREFRGSRSWTRRKAVVAAQGCNLNRS